LFGLVQCDYEGQVSKLRNEKNALQTELAEWKRKIIGQQKKLIRRWFFQEISIMEYVDIIYHIPIILLVPNTKKNIKKSAEAILKSHQPIVVLFDNYISLSPVRSSVVKVLCDPISFHPPPIPHSESCGRPDVRSSAAVCKEKISELGTNICKYEWNLFIITLSIQVSLFSD
jgi:hypothetical protein